MLIDCCTGGLSLYSRYLKCDLPTVCGRKWRSSPTMATTAPGGCTHGSTGTSVCYNMY